MDYVEIITLITGILVIGILTGVYINYRVRQYIIRKFVVKGNKEIKRLHYILKINKFKIVDVDKKIRFKVLIGNKTHKFDFNVIALAKKKKKRYICFIQQDFEQVLDYEMLFKTIMTKCIRGLVINPELFDLQEYRLKLKGRRSMY